MKAAIYKNRMKDEGRKKKRNNEKDGKKGSTGEIEHAKKIINENE